MRTPGTSSTDGGVLIDLASISQVDISKDQKSVVVGAGAQWIDVYQPLEKHGLSVVGGRVADVGVGGLLTGGEYNPLPRVLTNDPRRHILLDEQTWACLRQHPLLLDRTPEWHSGNRISKPASHSIPCLARRRLLQLWHHHVVRAQDRASTKSSRHLARLGSPRLFERIHTP